jgi:hypothetical protein
MRKWLEEAHKQNTHIHEYVDRDQSLSITVEMENLQLESYAKQRDKSTS